MGITDIDQARDRVTIMSTECIARAIVREGSLIDSGILVEFPRIEINDRVTGPCQHVGVSERCEIGTFLVMTANKCNGLASVICQAIVKDVLAGRNNVVPVIVVAIVGQVVLHGKKQRHVENVAVTANGRGIGRVDIF